MSDLSLYSCILIGSTFLSSVSQVMLKKSAGKKYGSRIREYLNPLVIAAYVIFFACTFISMFSLRVVPLSISPVLEATGYIFIGILGYVFLRERLSKRQLVGMALIITGIIIASI